MRLVNPRGRIVSVREPLASYYASRDGWQVLDDAKPQAEQVEVETIEPDTKKSTDYTVREATELAKSMTPEQLAEFVQGDTRKSIQSLL
jgi:hypothetical protein